MYIIHSVNLDKSGVTEKVPSKQYFYWQEKDALRTGQRPVLTKNGTEYTGFSFKNWNTSKFGNGFAYFNDIDLMLNDNLTLYAIYEDDVKPYGVITVTPTVWEDTNGLVTVTAEDEGSGLSKIVLVRQSLVTGKRNTVATYNCNGANTKYVTYRQREEGEFIFIAYVYDMDGNASVFTSQRMKIDKSNPQIHGLENTNTDWTNIAPVISVNATDYLYGTTYTAAGVNSVLIIDDMGNIVARGTNNATFTLTEKYEGTHTFTIRVYDNIGHETTDSVTTHYDITASAMNGTESTRVDNSVYVQDNIIDQMIDDYYTNSRYANDSSGVKNVVLYECRDGELKEVKNSNTRKDFASPSNQNAFHEKYTIKEKDKNVEYYLLVATDFAGNKTVKKITSQRYILTLMRTSIDKSTYVL